MTSLGVRGLSKFHRVIWMGSVNLQGPSILWEGHVNLRLGAFPGDSLGQSDIILSGTLGDHSLEQNDINLGLTENLLSNRVI